MNTHSPLLIHVWTVFYCMYKQPFLSTLNNLGGHHILLCHLIVETWTTTGIHRHRHHLLQAEYRLQMVFMLSF